MEENERKTPGEGGKRRFDMLSSEEKRRVIAALSRGLLSPEEQRELAEACREGRVTREEKKQLTRAFTLARMTDEERQALLERRKQARTGDAARTQQTPEYRPGEGKQTPPTPSDTAVPGHGAEGETPLAAKTAEIPMPSVPPRTPMREETTVSRAVPGGQGDKPMTEAHTTVRPIPTSGKRGTAPGDTVPRDPEAGTRVLTAKKRNTPPKKPMDDKVGAEEEAYEADHTAITSLLKGVVYIVAVLVISIFASWAIIAVGNDIYAFVKDDGVTTVVITEDMTVNDVARMLYENDIIEYPTVYELYIRMKKRSTDYLVGEYEISPSMNYKELNRTFTYVKPDKEQVVVTIPEGYTVDQIIERFLSYGIGTRAGFEDAINNFAYDDFRFYNELPETLSPERKYKLEGYLYPDTYFFFKDDSEVAVIHKILTNFDRKFTEAHYARAEAIGMSVDEVVTLASMIQAEGTTLADFENISSVFHNRLDNPRKFPLLQSDATLQYILDKRKVTLTASDLKIESGYNTYLSGGLPPGGICNPGLDAIDCALYPADTNYFYFLADKRGVTHFSETLEEHEALKKEHIG